MTLALRSPPASLGRASPDALAAGRALAQMDTNFPKAQLPSDPTNRCSRRHLG